MKAFFLRHKKLHIWLLADLSLLAAFFLIRGNRTWMNTLADRVTTPLKRMIGSLCYRVPVSVMEILCVLLVLFAAAYVVWSVIAICWKKDQRKQRAYRAVLGAVCISLSLYAGFFFLWGVNFWTDSFQDKSGIVAQPVAPEDLLKVTVYFAQQLIETADDVPRDENGVFAVSWQEILEKSPHIYDPLEEEMPFLKFDDPGVKPMMFSEWMSVISYTGFYCACTGESNVNINAPACLLPSTVAHELAHQRGIASEQECNFLGILAATTSGEPEYVYSGWLDGFIYAGNALYRLSPEIYWAIREVLPETVKADLEYNTAYWNQYQDTVAEKVADTVYDKTLKVYGDARGLQSYGTVVDMLVAYYA